MTRVPNRRVRLGRGQVTSRETELWEARRMFFRAVHAVSPQAYWSLFPDEPGDAAFKAYRDRWGDDPAAMIRDWQVRWNLTDAWCADVAGNTLRARLKPHVNGLTTLIGINGPAPDWFVTPRFDGSGAFGLLHIPLVELCWNQGTETRKYVRDRLIDIIDAELDRVAAETSMPRTREKTPEHFVWLAKSRVLREHPQSIAETIIDAPDAPYVHAVHRKRTVEKGIKDTANLIGLDRPDENNSLN